MYHRLLKILLVVSLTLALVQTDTSVDDTKTNGQVDTTTSTSGQREDDSLSDIDDDPPQDDTTTSDQVVDTTTSDQVVDTTTSDQVVDTTSSETTADSGKPAPGDMTDAQQQDQQKEVEESTEVVDEVEKKVEDAATEVQEKEEEVVEAKEKVETTTEALEEAEKNEETKKKEAEEAQDHADTLADEAETDPTVQDEATQALETANEAKEAAETAAEETQQAEKEKTKATEDLVEAETEQAIAEIKNSETQTEAQLLEGFYETAKAIVELDNEAKTQFDALPTIALNVETKQNALLALAGDDATLDDTKKEVTDALTELVTTGYDTAITTATSIQTKVAELSKSITDQSANVEDQTIKDEMTKLLSDLDTRTTEMTEIIELANEAKTSANAQPDLIKTWEDLAKAFAEEQNALSPSTLLSMKKRQFASVSESDVTDAKTAAESGMTEIKEKTDDATEKVDNMATITDSVTGASETSGNQAAEQANQDQTDPVEENNDALDDLKQPEDTDEYADCMAECAENNLTRVAEGAEEEDCEAKCEQFNTEDKLGFWVWFMIIVGSAMVFSLLIWWGCSPKKHTAHSNEQPLLDNEHYPSGYMAHPSKVDSDSDDYNPLYQPHLYN